MVCCVTGHRSIGFPFPREDTCEAYVQYLHTLDHLLDDLIQNGYVHFITGMAEGADLDFARAVIRKKKNHSQIKLEAALPYPVRTTGKATGTAAERLSVLLLCDQVSEVSSHYHSGCMQKRNMYMVDRADLVLAIWNGEEKGGTWNTIRYARKKEKALQYSMLNE